ncbi:MAG: uridine diphosphate-N-acetylglucosamine-binding protein YvcK [Acidobacteria bacterium]|nr:uridine diphosphate-N-acetylglucosamine-binding protein YvcK [Acidobacteriota bacterium]
MRVVAIGGGTGLSRLLRGLKRHVIPSAHGPAATADASLPRIEELSAVVTVTDDGGSSGRLRQALNILPPGDIRNCLVALSEDEALLSRLFRHRFSGGEGLQGHSFGNLFLAALNEITGDFGEAVKLASAILATRGRIFPATTADVRLVAHMDDGTIVHGETRITASSRRIVRLELAPKDAKPLAETLEAIARADLITIGPGSLFTSLVTNLLVHGLPEAIAGSPALKVFVGNLMSQANESLGFTASDHIRVLTQHAGWKLFDYALVNNAPLSTSLRAKYALEAATPIVVDVPAMEEMGVKVILGDYVEVVESGGSAVPEKGGHAPSGAAVARHAADRVARDLLRIAAQHRRTPNCDHQAIAH